MRGLVFGSLWLVAVVMARPAVGSEADNPDIGSCPACTSSQPCAPECGGLRSSIRGPVYGANPLPCCDKVWAVFCEERAKAHAFWSQFGSPSEIGCRIGCRLEMVMAPWRWGTECSTCGPTANWSGNQYQATPVPAGESAQPEANPEAKPEAQSKLPDPPKADALSRVKQTLSGLFR
jgi:hypothetical protein